MTGGRPTAHLPPINVPIPTQRKAPTMTPPRNHFVTTPAATANLVAIAAALGQFATRSDAIRFALEFTAARLTPADVQAGLSAPAVDHA
jgi:hypothetical protein